MKATVCVSFVFSRCSLELTRKRFEESQQSVRGSCGLAAFSVRSSFTPFPGDASYNSSNDDEEGENHNSHCRSSSFLLPIPLHRNPGHTFFCFNKKKVFFSNAP